MVVAVVRRLVLAAAGQVELAINTAHSISIWRILSRSLLVRAAPQGQRVRLAVVLAAMAAMDFVRLLLMRQLALLSGRFLARVAVKVDRLRAQVAEVARLILERFSFPKSLTQVDRLMARVSCLQAVLVVYSTLQVQLVNLVYRQD